MSKESNNNWQNRQKQKGDCLYQAVACLKLSLPAMKLWEAFENVCLDWLIFPVLRKSLKIIKTIIKLLTKLSPRNEKLEVGTRQWIKFPHNCIVRTLISVDVKITLRRKTWSLSRWLSTMVDLMNLYGWTDFNFPDVTQFCQFVQSSLRWICQIKCLGC